MSEEWVVECRGKSSRKWEVFSIETDERAARVVAGEAFIKAILVTEIRIRKDTTKNNLLGQIKCISCSLSFNGAYGDSYCKDCWGNGVRA
jgi:hypothetical protein